jgi:ABC-type nitrate/sulfonate/bicarbonate transport system substrate-binding protein
MSAVPSIVAPSPALKQVWFTRCPVPTASGLAYKLGWLGQEFGRDGISVATLQDAPRGLARHHYDHELPGLFREGGNVPALAARASGAPTRLIGLTWIDEWQAILVRPDSGISKPEHLLGRRVALPAFTDTRGGSIARAMSLHGYKGALSLARLTLDDVVFVDTPATLNVEGINNSPRPEGSRNLGGLWSGLPLLATGEVDAVYVKGASAVDAAKEHGAIVGIDLDTIDNKRTRVNNGTPRPITVHEDLLRDHFDLVVRFLAQTLRAADWASAHLDDVRAILQNETRAGLDGVSTAYRNDFHKHLHPDLSSERLDLLAVQKNFLWLHGFLEHDVDVHAWADHRPLEAAREYLAEHGL